MSYALYRNATTLYTAYTELVPGYIADVVYSEMYWIPVQSSQPYWPYVVAQMIDGKEIPVIPTGLTLLTLSPFATALKVSVPTYGPYFVPPTAGQVGAPSNTGPYRTWEAGAKSLTTLAENADLISQFKVSPQSEGVVVGIGNRANSAPFNIEFGFQLENGVAYAFNGARIGGGVKYAEGAVFTIVQHTHTKWLTISALANGTTDYLLYTDSVTYKQAVDAGQPSDYALFGSIGAGTSSVGQSKMNAVIYNPGDYVYDPVFRLLEGSGAVMRALQTVCGNNPHPFANNSFLPLRARAGVGIHADNAFLPMAGGGSDHPSAYSKAKLAPLTTDARTSPFTVSYPNSVTSLQPLGSISGSFSSGGRSIASFLPMAGLASYHTGGSVSAASFRPLQGISFGDARGLVFMPSLVNPTSTIDGAKLVIALMNEAGVASDLMVFQLYSDGSLASLVSVAPLITAGNDADAVMASIIRMVAGVPLADEDNETWVMNLNTSASYAYEQYGFNSFAKLGDSYYGAKANGVFLLEGDTDAGQPIRASAGFGKKNFGTLKKKRIEAVYAAMSSTGTMVLKIIVDEGSPEAAEYLYTARGYTQSLETQRFDTGRGIKANYLTFEIYNQAGCDFELEQLEFAVIDINRRL